MEGNGSEAGPRDQGGRGDFFLEGYHFLCVFGGCDGGSLVPCLYIISNIREASYIGLKIILP